MTGLSFGVVVGHNSSDDRNVDVW
ncbi:hypothetical protein PSCLAVI8L_130550 [Pseudoclavibacter sp. 8L]|nr:hypothetical protein PSCLAVI8L_130550 [Pseudoclavibacter sp. 8L]